VTDPAPATDLLTVDDLSPAALADVLDAAERYRAALAAGEAHADLPGRQVALLFGQPSTRTRVSLAVGIDQLGGNAVFLAPGATQLDRGEPLADTARVLARYVDAVVARLPDHGDLDALADHADVPVVNALTDRAHPCQAVADLLTLRHVAGGLDGAQAAWVGDGNNVARSFAVAGAMAGVDVRVATPPGYGLGEDVADRVGGFPGSVTPVGDAETAVAGADAVYTDVWASMHDDADAATREAAFADYRVDEALLAGTDAAVMHCLPAHRGEEVTDAVIEGERSVVFRQAENRLHASKALLAALVDDGGDARADAPARTAAGE
jgi:ornithine carbamoyltransferase